MSLRIEFHPEAQEDLQAAYRWYRERNRTVARRFLREIDTLIATIGEAPERGRSHVASTRRLVCRRFPFVVVYRRYEGLIVIVAVAHGRRRPGYWRRR